MKSLRLVTFKAMGGPLFWILVVALTVTLCMSKFRLAKAADIAKVNPYRPETILPHTVRLKMEIFDHTGKLTRTVFETHAVRRDGSTVLVEEDNGLTSRMISFTSKAIVRTVDSQQLRSSQSVSFLPLVRNPAHTCSVPPEQVQGFDYVEGYRAVRIKLDAVTEWYGIDNGCALLQSHWAFDSGEVTNKSLISLEMGEPQHNLFEVPELYEEVAPSVLSKPKNPMTPQWQHLDRDYYLHRLARLPQ